eukprot:TRINITY_DN15733_c0_g1_i1.p2 TRINITY_DN15733_c0_g1~~TRINITY_DN15733_c0_g1_i1.p2  ORF type:complete len:224 (+),score=28.76 TRINITY_DN15733_c0_g1_i1:50-673(+)
MASGGGALQALASHNLWLMPVSSSRYAHRSRAIGDAIAGVFPASGPGLRVLCVQEAWSWQPGPLTWVVWLCSLPGAQRFMRYNKVGDFFGFALVIWCIVWSVVTWPLNFLTPAFLIWNARKPLSRTMSKHGLQCVAGSRHQFGGGLPVFDHGLAIFATHAADASGFTPFPQVYEFTEEWLANKGVLWAHWFGGDADTLRQRAGGCTQ